MTTQTTSGSLWAQAHLGLPMALRVASTLSLADHVDAGATTAESLAARTGCDTDALSRLVAFLARRGVFEVENGVIGLGEYGHELLDRDPGGLRGHLDLTTVFGQAELCFVSLLDSIRTGAAAYPAFFGRTLWQTLAEEPEMAASFHAHMRATLPNRWSALAEALDWSRFDSVYDIGGGDGSLLHAIRAAHPQVAGTVVDRTEAIEQATTLGYDSSGVRFVQGDFLAALPDGGDAYVLNLVLHNWDDATAANILRRCAAAAGEGGRVLVVECFGPDGRSAHTGMDLRMLALFGGKERSLNQLDWLACSAGLTLIAEHSAGDVRVIEFRAGKVISS